MSIIDQVNEDSLVHLVQTGNEVGRVYSIDYEFKFLKLITPFSI